MLVQKLFVPQSVHTTEFVSPTPEFLPIQFNPIAMLQIPSVKECWLVGTRRAAFSAVATALWNILPSEIRIRLELEPQLCFAFYY